MPVHSYAPELLELLIRVGDGEKVTILLASEKVAHRLRFRIHNLRKEMRKESHPLLQTAERAKFKIQSNPPALVGFQSDVGFADAIRAAGIEVRDPTPPAAASPLDEFKPTGGLRGKGKEKK